MATSEAIIAARRDIALSVSRNAKNHFFGVVPVPPAPGFGSVEPPVAPAPGFFFESFFGSAFGSGVVVVVSVDEVEPDPVTGVVVLEEPEPVVGEVPIVDGAVPPVALPVSVGATPIGLTPGVVEFGVVVVPVMPGVEVDELLSWIGADVFSGAFAGSLLPPHAIIPNTIAAAIPCVIFIGETSRFFG